MGKAQRKINKLRRKKLKQSIIVDPNYDASFNYIIDLRLTNMKLSFKELQLYGNWVQETLNTNHKNLALLTTNPNQVSNALLFKLNEVFVYVERLTKLKEVSIPINETLLRYIIGIHFNKFL